MSETDTFPAGAAGVEAATAALIEARSNQEVAIVPEDTGAPPVEWTDDEGSTEPLAPRAAGKRLAEAREQRREAYAKAAADPLALRSDFDDVAGIDAVETTPTPPSPATVPFHQGGPAQSTAQAQGQIIGEAFQHEFANRFPEIQTDQDLATVATYDPARAQEAAAFWQSAIETMTRVGAAVVKADMEAAQLNEVHGRAADLAFANANPDYARLTPAQRRQVHDDIVVMLRWAGMDDHQIVRAYAGLEGINLRGAGTQAILWHAYKHLRGEAQLATAKPAREPPKVQRPGTSQSKAERREHSVATIERNAPAEFRNPREAARVLAAKRSAAR